MISTNALSFRLGAVLLQKSIDVWKPVAYASCSMTDTERQYAQIERGISCHLGLRQICQLWYWKTSPNWIWPQAPHPIIKFQTIQLLSYHLELYIFDFEWKDSIIQCVTFLVNCCMQQTLCPGHYHPVLKASFKRKLNGLWRHASSRQTQVRKV